MPVTLTSYGETMRSSNSFAFRKPITLGSLDDLFAHHRSLTAGWSMTSTPPEPAPPAPPADPPAPPAPPADPPKPDPPAQFDPITSQEDFDKRLGARLAREKEKYSDYDELKKKAEAHDAAAEAAKTEAEKAIDAARKDGENTATQAANARLVKAEARALAAQAGFRSLADVNLVDLSGIKVGDDGEADAEAIKAKLKELSDAEPWRIDDKKPAPRPDHTQGGGGGGGDDKPATVAEAREKARAAREAKRPKSA